MKNPHISCNKEPPMTRLSIVRYLAIPVLLLGIAEPISPHPTLRTASPPDGAVLRSIPLEGEHGFELRAEQGEGREPPVSHPEEARGAGPEEGAVDSPSALKSGESQRPESEALEMVQAFHEALRSGNGGAAASLLAEGAVVLEGGTLETREEYLEHHLEADMAFAAAVDRSAELRVVRMVGDVAWVATTSRAVGSYGGRSIDSRGLELVVLQKGEEGWRIQAVHWSSSS